MAGASTPLKLPRYADPLASVWRYAAEMQAAVYHNDPYRPRPTAGSPNTSNVGVTPTGTLSAEGYIVTNT